MLKIRKRFLILALSSTFILSGCNQSDTNDVKYMTIKEARELAKKETNENEQVFDNDTIIDKANNNYVIKEVQPSKIESVEEIIDNLLEEENIENAKTATIEKFIFVTDYIFYDTEINGKKFKDQTEETKTAILNKYELLDKKMDEKFPNYKQKLDNKYQITKVVITDKYDEISSKVKNKTIEKIGQDKYNEYNNTYGEIKEDIKDSLETSKKITEKVADEAKTKVKSWYEDLKNKH